MKSRTYLAAALAVLLMAPVVAAETLNVPSDTHATVQSAVDAVQAGDTIVIKGGPFLENVLRTDMPDDVTIRGKGKPVIDAGQNGVGLDLQNGTALTITGITVTNASSHGISLDACPGATVSRCRIDNVSGNGIHVNDSTDVTVERNTLSEIGGDGIRLQHNDFSGTEQTGPADVFRNRCTSCGNFGIRAQGMDSVTVERNRVEDGTDGIAVTGFIGGVGGDDGEVRRNKLFDLAGTGILVNGSTPTVERNAVVRVFGVSVSTSATDGVFDRNRVFDSGTGSAAPAIENQGQGNQFTRNRIVRCNGNAVDERGTGAHYERNTVILPSAYGFNIQPFGPATFVRNKVNRSGEDGFYVFQGANRFERNLVIKAGDDGFHVISDANEFVSNRVVRADVRGFQVDSSDNSFESNSASRCETGFDVRGFRNSFTGNRASRNADLDLHDSAGVGENTYTDNRFKNETIEDITD